MLVDCPKTILGKQCYIKYVLGSEEVETNTKIIDKHGHVGFNYKIERKMFLESHSGKGKNQGGYKKKNLDIFVTIFNEVNDEI